MKGKTWQPGDDKPRTATKKRTRDVELHDGQPTAPPAAPHRPNWRAPDDWREAAMAAERGEIDNAAEAQKILDVLNNVSWDKPQPRVQAPARAPAPPRAAPAPEPLPPARAAVPKTATEYTEDCDCVVLNLGQSADPDCAKCGGTGYTGP